MQKTREKKPCKIAYTYHSQLYCISFQTIKTQSVCKYNTVYFSFFDQILHFANGERYKNVDIMILDDDIPEGDETFQLILTNPSPGLELGGNTIGN